LTEARVDVDEPDRASDPTVEKWRDAVVPMGTTILDAIHSLERSSLQIVLVVAAGDILSGTITDGDIRRGLLHGLDLTSQVDKIMNCDPLVAPPLFDRDTVVQLMKANKLRQLPVVDQQGCLVGLHMWNDVIEASSRTNRMVIMVGGRGVRLRPHTENCPKPMLPIEGKPMLEHILERGKAEGFRRFVFAINYLGHMIEDYFGDGSRWHVEIEYLREQSALGTAGALSLFSSSADDPVVVSNGDVLTGIRYGELLDFHVRNDAAATMAVRMEEREHPFGVVLTDGIDIIGFEEKPVSRTQVNAGIYVLSRAALDALMPNEHCDMPTLFSRLEAGGARTIVYAIYEPWLDVGRDEDLRRANSHS